MPITPSSGHAYRALPEVSSMLAAVSAVAGDAVVVDQRAVADEAGLPSPLTRRRVRLVPSRVIRGDQALRRDAECVFEGLTLVQPNAGTADPRSPTLFLEGQRFFDEPHPAGPIPVLVLIGDPPPSAPMGFGGRTAHVVGGRLDGVPVRPFRLSGADRDLADVVPSLVGWQGDTTAALSAASAAAHPLIPLDALRIAARRELAIEAIEKLATALLHPTQAPEAKVLALEILRDVLRRLSAGSQAAERLVRATAGAWRLERSQPVEAAYLEAWLGAVEQVRAATVGAELRALATDTTATDRVARLRAELAQALASLGPRHG